MNPNKIIIKKRYRKEMGDLEPLKKSISEIGLLHPIVVNENNELIAGERRLKAIKELGWNDAPITRINLKEIIRGEFDENNVRKEFTITESVAIWEAMENLQKTPFERFHRKSRGLSDSERGLPPIKRAAKVLGMSTDSLSKAKQVIDSGKKDLIEQMDKTGTINSIYRKIKFAEQKEEIKKLPLIKDKYDILVIDPPWAYERNEINDKGHRGTTPYVNMSLDKLKELKLPIKEDAVVWLWVTNSMFKEAFELIDSWGLDRKTILTWDKQIMGVGHFLRNITEHCILCFKGKPYFNNTKWTTLISEKRTTHSTKPEIFYKMVDEICAGRKLDYFARKKREGWDVYGDEIK